MRTKYQMKNRDGSIIEDSYDGHLMWQDLRVLIDLPLLETQAQE